MCDEKLLYIQLPPLSAIWKRCIWLPWVIHIKGRLSTLRKRSRQLVWKQQKPSTIELWAQKFIFQIGFPNPYGIQLIYSFSRHHIPTDSVAPFTAYKHKHNRPIYFIDSVDNTKLSCYALPSTQHHLPLQTLSTTDRIKTMAIRVAVKILEKADYP